jgi:hypothetical protein
MNATFQKKLKGTPLQIMEDYFNREDELINGVVERRRAASDEKFARHYGQDNLQVGDHVRVRLESLISEMRKRTKSGFQKYNIVRYSPQIFVVSHKYPPAEGTLGYASYCVQDLNGAFILKGARPQRFRFNELIAVPNGLTVASEITQTKADKLNRVNETEIIAPVPDVKEEVVKIEKPPKAPLPVSLWKSPEWLELLKTKVITIDEVQYFVLDVDYERSIKKYMVKMVRFDDIVEGKPIKGTVRVKRELAVVLSNCKSETWFNGDMDALVKAQLPAVHHISGGRILVGGRYIARW